MNKAVKMMTGFRGGLFFILALAFLFDALFDLVPDVVLLTLTTLVFLVSIPDMSRLPRLMTCVLLLLAHVIFFRYGGDWLFWQKAMIQNLSYVALIVTVPLLSIPIREGGYLPYIDGLAKRFAAKPTFFYTMVAGCSAILGAFMNIGALYMMNDLFGAKIKENKRETTDAIIQGFSLSLFLSPYIGAVAIVLYLLDVSLFPFMFWGMLLAAAGILIIVVRLALFQRRPEHNRLEEPNRPEENNRTMEEGAQVSRHTSRHRKGVELAFGVLGIFASVVLLERWLQIHFIVSVSLTALAFPIVWLLLLGKIKQLPGQAADYKNKVLPNVHNQTVLILAVAFFSQMMQLTEISAYLAGLLATVMNLSLIFAVLFILCLILIPSLFGIHPMIPIILIAANVSPEFLGLEPSLFALMLTVGFTLSQLVSPVSGLTIVAGAIFSIDPVQFIRSNWKFVFLLLAAATALIGALNTLYGA